MNDSNTAKYSKKITKNQEKKMYATIYATENNTWSKLNNCTVFACEVFKSATGISFKSWSEVTILPSVLKERIQKSRCKMIKKLLLIICILISGIYLISSCSIESKPYANVHSQIITEIDTRNSEVNIKGVIPSSLAMGKE